jgi:hypothetical protein
MAAGATVILSGDWMISIGNRRQTIATANFGTSYTTNGQAVTPAQFGLGTIDYMDMSTSGGYVGEYIPSTGKVKLYWQTNPGAAGGADVPLIEVDSTTDVHATVFTIVCTGR